MAQDPVPGPGQDGDPVPPGAVTPDWVTARARELRRSGLAGGMDEPRVLAYLEKLGVLNPFGIAQPVGAPGGSPEGNTGQDADGAAGGDLDAGPGGTRTPTPVRKRTAGPAGPGRRVRPRPQRREGQAGPDCSRPRRPRRRCRRGARPPARTRTGRVREHPGRLTHPRRADPDRLVKVRVRCRASR